MPAVISTSQVWAEIERRVFAVLSYVTPRGEARSAGIVYVVRDGMLYIRTDADSWKARHIRLNPNVAVNITIPKRVPFLPWIKIPDATISFTGTARVIEFDDAADALKQALTRATSHDPESRVRIGFIEVVPVGDFKTYGVGVPLLDMRDPTKARGRVPVS